MRMEQIHWPTLLCLRPSAHAILQQYLINFNNYNNTTNLLLYVMSYDRSVNVRLISM